MTDAEGAPTTPDAIRHVLRRAALLTSGAGIAFGILSVISWYLIQGDRVGLAESGDAVAYYEDTGFAGSQVAGLYLLPFAAILFLWFIVALRGWIRGTSQRRNMLISDLQLVSGTVFTGLFMVGAGAIAATTIVADADPDLLSTGTLRSLSSFGYALMDVMGVRMAAVFVIATASLGMTTRVLPRWFNLTSYVFGIVLMLTPVVGSALILVFPIWVIVLSIMLLVHIARLPDDELPGYVARHTPDQVFPE